MWVWRFTSLCREKYSHVRSCSTTDASQGENIERDECLSHNIFSLESESCLWPIVQSNFYFLYFKKQVNTMQDRNFTADLILILSIICGLIV